VVNRRHHRQVHRRDNRPINRLCSHHVNQVVSRMVRLLHVGGYRLWKTLATHQATVQLAFSLTTEYICSILHPA
jgi:hypothetical protein